METTRTPRFAPAQVRDYYDRHTPAFLRFGQGGGSLHRAVWAPGVRTRRDAFHAVDDRIAALLGELGTAVPHVVDLGCGVGESLCHLAGRREMRGTGVTLSPVQAELAARRIARRGLADRVSCLEGDHCALPHTVAPADLAFAIESFVHATSAARFLAECARLVRSGGLLVICDDLRRPVDAPEADRALEQFTHGWRVNTLVTGDELRAYARAAGFEHVSTTDLTPFLEIGRSRDRVLALLQRLAGWLPGMRARLDYVAGGHALQTCLARGWIGYELAVFRRTRAGTERFEAR